MPETTPKKRKLISVVTPCYNERENVKDCYEAVKGLFEGQLARYDFEHIFCDNASTDGTLGILRELAKGDRRVKVIVNSRNFGAMRSNFNGVLSAKGDAVLLFLPADLQDPPELIPGFVRKWEEGYYVVAGARKIRQENPIMALLRKLFYRTVTALASVSLPLDVGDFQLVDKVVVESLRKFDDYYPYMRGMVASCGFKSTTIDYTWKSRKKGFTKTNWFALIDQALNGLLYFTNVPLRICMLFGVVIAGLSVFYAFTQLLINILYYRQFASPGIPTLIISVFFFSGVQLFFLGILGEYISAIHFQVRKRPMVLEVERINFD